MGKGQILSGGTDGQYDVKLILHREHVQNKIDVLQVQINLFEIHIDSLEDGLIKDRVTFQKNALVKKKEYLENNMPEDPKIEAWCADLTEDLSGDVGTIEIPGERGEVNIQPGYENNAVFDSDRDGQLQPAIASRSAAGTFYNMAMLPGWQKWMPTFRYGIITSIDNENNTCNVTLDSEKSSQQDLDVNFVTKLSDLPIEYMECNCAAFNVGDEVIIQFTSVNTQTEENWATGKVIGFKNNPKTCGYSFKLTRGDDTLLTEESGLFGGFTVKDSEGNGVSITTPEYNIEKESWSFHITDEFDPLGYFISYNCTDGINTQYPYKYKTADKENADDLIKPENDNYEDIIPYWRYIESEEVNGYFPHGADGQIPGDIGGYLKKIVVVYSSVEYSITHRLVGYDEIPDRQLSGIVYTIADLVIGYGPDPNDEPCCRYWPDRTAIIGDVNTVLKYEYYWNQYGPGWGDSLVKINFKSSMINYTEVYGRRDGFIINETETSDPDIEGTTHEFMMRNKTDLNVPITGTLMVGTNGICINVLGGSSSEIGLYKVTCITANAIDTEGVWEITNPSSDILGYLTVSPGTSGTGDFSHAEIEFRISYNLGYNSIGDCFGINISLGEGNRIYICGSTPTISCHTFGEQDAKYWRAEGLMDFELRDITYEI